MGFSFLVSFIGSCSHHYHQMLDKIQVKIGGAAFANGTITHCVMAGNEWLLGKKGVYGCCSVLLTTTPSHSAHVSSLFTISVICSHPVTHILLVILSGNILIDKPTSLLG